MGATEKSLPDSNPPKDLHLAFDVGHSSIGWAVLQTLPGNEPHLLGCGAVIFQADDCLASQRRTFRRQRRHIRSTRLRIARLKSLLAHLGVLDATQLDAVTSSSPWFLAARVLRGGPLLTWPELWDVLRWYAHNRGYDGNKAWSRHEEDAAAAKDDTEKEQRARGLLADFERQHGRPGSMAEVWCDLSGLDPLGTKTSAALAGLKRPKGQNAAFPREQVEREVAAILRAHFGRLPAAAEALVTALMADWRAIPCEAIRVPLRYGRRENDGSMSGGGLLFGQLVPRFENRIIARCPITFERIYQQVFADTDDAARARDEAHKFAKVPAASAPEFFRYRWAMQLANILVQTPSGPRRLTPEQRRALDETARQRGAFTKGDFKKAVRALTGGTPDNLDQMLSHPDAERALVVDPVRRLLADKDVAPLVTILGNPLQSRLRGQLRRGRRVTLATVAEWAAAAGEGATFEAALQRQLDIINTRRARKTAETTREALLATALQIHPPSGRAPHSRDVMRDVAEFVFNEADEQGYGRHPDEGTEGAPNNGPRFRSEAIRTAQLQRAIDDQTNNHLVRHRLRLLDRLHADLLATYAAGEEARIDRITIEVNRDLREFSGKPNKQIAQDLGLRLDNFKSVAKKLETQLVGTNHRITPGLLRKARIAEDLGWTCPYTGKPYDIFDLLHRRVDKDHIIPRSQRPSDSLDSLVITFAEVNKMKGKRTAARFVEDEQGRAVEGLPQLSIKPLATYLKDVKALETFRGHDDDKRRKRKRQDQLQTRDYLEKEFVPRDLTQTSQLVRLGAQALEKTYAHLPTGPVLTSLPGSVTGAVRKSWRVLGCLAEANAAILDPATGEARTKTEIRDITHLHHALDATVLAFASFILPGRGRDGAAWQLLLLRRLTTPEQAQARQLFGNSIEIEQNGGLRLNDLPATLKRQISARLAERRVVQHIPAETAGLRAELNAWRVLGTHEGEVHLRQRIRQPDGTRPIKERREKTGKLIGLQPGKLQRLQAALVIADNYGLALDPAPEIIPFHKVWVRLRDLRAKNGGRPIRVLRNGMLVRLSNTKPNGSRDGIWRIVTVQATLKIDFVKPDVVGRPKKGPVWREVSLASLGLQNIRPVGGGLTGVSAMEP